MKSALEAVEPNIPRPMRGTAEGLSLQSRTSRKAGQANSSAPSSIYRRSCLGATFHTGCCLQTLHQIRARKQACLTLLPQQTETGHDWLARPARPRDSPSPRGTADRGRHAHSRQSDTTSVSYWYGMIRARAPKPKGSSPISRKAPVACRIS